MRDANEDCDDGGTAGGDGCSADCTVDDGFACAAPNVQPLRVTVDGLAHCLEPLPIDVPAWPAWRSYYVSGAVRHQPPDMHNANFGVAVDGVRNVLLTSERATVGSVEEAEATYRGMSSAPFSVGADAEVVAGFFDAFCDDNVGTTTAELRPMDVCFPVACADDAACPLGRPCLDGACVPCGDGVRDAGEQCDDGALEDGDGCSARCVIEDGFECAAPPAIAPIELTVDGFVECVTPIPLDLPPWPAWRSVYVSGAVNFQPGAFFNANVGVRVDGVVHRLSTSERATVGSVEEAQATYPGVTSPLFAVGEGAVVEGGFFDGVCDDNVGAATAQIRAVDLCTPAPR